MERGKFQRDMRELSGVMGLFYILIVVMVTLLCTCKNSYRCTPREDTLCCSVHFT